MSNCRNKRGQFTRCRIGKGASRGRRASQKIKLEKLDHTKDLIRIAISNPNPDGYEGEVLVEVHDGIPQVHVWDGSTDSDHDDPARSMKLNKRARIKRR